VAKLPRPWRQRWLNGILRALACVPSVRLAVARLSRWRFLRRLSWFRRQYVQRMHYLMARNVLPEMLVLETTNRCNAHCRMCPHPRMQRAQGVMGEALFKKIIDECAVLGIRRVQLNATGDPLLDPEFSRRISYAKQQGIGEVSFFTNALLLTPERTAEILAAGPDMVFLSLDGYEAAAYESVRGLPFEKVKKKTKAKILKESLF